MKYEFTIDRPITDCYGCPLKMVGLKYCEISNAVVTAKKRPADCPLKEIPMGFVGVESGDIENYTK